MDDHNKKYFIMNIFIEITRDVWVRGSTLPLLASKERRPLFCYKQINCFVAARISRTLQQQKRGLSDELRTIINVTI